MRSGKNLRAPSRPLILILALSLFHLAASAASAIQTAPSQAKSQEIQPQTQPERIVAAPQNIRESTAIYVFLGWMWAAIAALIYFLRLKIKEVDRLHAAGYFSLESPTSARR